MAENEVQVKFSEKLSDKLMNVESALPKDFNRERFVQNCLAVLNGNKDLSKANTNEVIQGLLKGAYLGLDFMNREAYLICYGNSVNFQTSYIGEKKFVKKYSIRKIQDIFAKVVREGDEFEEFIIDGHPTINFRPKPFSNADIIGAFAIVLYSDGGMEYESMSVEDINKVRNTFSRAANSKAWKDTFDEMCKKTVLRRLCKHISTDFESTEARSAWDEGSDSDFSNASTPINNKEEVVDIFKEEDIIDSEITEEVVIPEEIEKETEGIFK